MALRDFWKSFSQSCGFYEKSIDLIKRNDAETMRKKVHNRNFRPHYEFTPEAAQAATAEMLDTILASLADKGTLNVIAYNTLTRGGSYDPDPASRAFMMMLSVIEAGRYDLLPVFANHPIDYNTGDAQYHPVTAVLKSAMSDDQKVEWVTIMASKGFGMVSGRNVLGHILAATEMEAGTARDLKNILTGAGVYMEHGPTVHTPRGRNVVKGLRL